MSPPVKYLVSIFHSIGPASSTGPRNLAGSAFGPAPTPDPVAASMLALHAPGVQKLKRRFGDDSQPVVACKKSKTISDFFKRKGSLAFRLLKFVAFVPQR